MPVSRMRHPPQTIIPVPVNGSPAPCNNGWRLVPEIIALSVAGTWAEARAEWELDHVYLATTPGRCLCGHRIVEHCEIFNSANGNRATVGSCCVKKFLGIPFGPIFTSLRRVARDIERALNARTIEYAYANTLITLWERDFYLDTWRKRDLSRKQLAVRVALNQRVLALVGEGNHASR